MKVHEDARRVASGSERPFARDTVRIHRLKRDIVGNRPDRSYLVDALAPLRPSDGPRLGTQQGSDVLNLAPVHEVASIRLTGH